MPAERKAVAYGREEDPNGRTWHPRVYDAFLLLSHAVREVTKFCVYAGGEGRA